MVESAQIAELGVSNRATLGYRAWALVALNFFFKGEKDVTLVVGEPVLGSKRRAIATIGQMRLGYTAPVSARAKLEEIVQLPPAGKLGLGL